MRALFMGSCLVDAYSKWIDVHMVPSTYSEATIAKLRAIFSNFGLPEPHVQTTQWVLQVLNSSLFSLQMVSSKY